MLKLKISNLPLLLNDYNERPQPPPHHYPLSFRNNTSWAKGIRSGFRPQVSQRQYLAFFSQRIVLLRNGESTFATHIFASCSGSKGEAEAIILIALNVGLQSGMLFSVARNVLGACWSAKPAALLCTGLSRCIGYSPSDSLFNSDTLQLKLALGVSPPRGDFVVIHDNGIHEVALQFCGCYATNDPYYAQLLRFRWFPATSTTPRTCATFACLKKFQMFAHQGKLSGYDFYHALEQLTNATGFKPPDRYQVFLRIAREYRHVLALKRAGRGHATTGVGGTVSGELAIRCPACPRPGVNLLEGWESAAPEDRCLYLMFLALDACFRLKRRAISNEIRDPGLGTGWSYFVEWEPYRDYLQTVKTQKEISSCSGLAAIDHANNKFSRGYSATGVVMGVCARHEFIQPNGVADLQAGERYANMDWVFLSILRHLTLLLRLLVSYDIASSLLRRRLDAATAEFARQEASFSLFRQQQDERVLEWQKMVEDFEADASKPNPYMPCFEGATEAQIRNELEQVDEEDEAAGRRRPIHDVSPSAFVQELLDIEAEQRRVLAEAELKKAKGSAANVTLMLS
ncbi:CxC2 domain-containing protein [Mycena indigotica]|uniref:CxC2 domain-containing protein n=1 Tax=Mycena indigotica TaxID=2126181 RepID=A0A8H6W0J8_9AGAR|nr:CxC2 domain-containing protein [Mycena indigotica]KAF7298606.1 CxC2 domain-containing protein [Mycena indigotica]